MKIKIKIFSLFLISSFLILNVGCNATAVDDLGDLAPSDPGTGGGGSTTLPGTSDGIAGANYFYVGVDNTINNIAHVHAETGFNEPCSISSSVTSSQDLTCIIDIPEGSLQYKGIAFKINQPASMCDSMGIFPYWYYNEEVGKGPTSIDIHTTKTIDAGGNVTYDPVFDCTVGNDGAAGVLDPGCSAQTEIVTTLSTTAGTTAIECVYDKSATAHKHNCCLGEYSKTLTVTTIDFTSNPSGTTTVATGAASTVKWGGDVANCIGGQGKGWDSVDSDNYPIGLRKENVDAPETHTEDIIVAAPNDVIELDSSRTWQTNRYAANYFDPALHLHTGYGSVTTSENPYYVSPINDRSGSAITSGYPSYQFVCLDPAHETTHRISIYVREWDSYPDYLTFITSLGATVVPDRFIDESIGGACDGTGGPCDDFHDSDDFLLHELNLGTYDTVITADRYKNFPYDVYK